MLEAGIEICWLLRQLEILLLSHEETQRKRKDFNAFVSLLFRLHIYT